MTNQKTNNNEVLIGQPIDYPAELVLSMKNIFNLEKRIQKAYLACIQYPDPQVAPKILIGLEVTGDIEIIISNILAYMENYDIKQLEFIDATKGQFMNYFSKIKPFYNLGN